MGILLIQSILIALVFSHSHDWFKRFKVPEGCDLVAAAALPVAFGTSHLGLIHRAQLKHGQVCPLSVFAILFLLNLLYEIVSLCL